MGGSEIPYLPAAPWEVGIIVGRERDKENERN